MELRDQRRLVNSIDVQRRSANGGTANETAVNDALKKAEAKIEELTAKLKEAGLSGNQ